MVNATEMAKPFGKTTKDWLRNQSTQEFISTLSAVRQILPTDLVVIKQGGSVEQGSWFHEDVALEFAVGFLRHSLSGATTASKNSCKQVSPLSVMMTKQ